MATGNGNGTSPKGPRCIALVGPFQSGKTTLLEAILARTGAIQRQGTVEAGTTVGDASKEARHHQHERGAVAPPPRLSWATATPSSIAPARSNSSTTCARRCRPSMPRSWSARRTKRKSRSCSSSCASWKTRRSRTSCFSTRSTRPTQRVHDVAAAAAAGLARAAAAAADPDLAGDIIIGFVDLALERAHIYKEHAPSEVIAARRRELRPREGSALHHAGDARRSRRRADGAIARGHSAAARQGIRRSRQGIARRPGLPGADRLGDPHQRRAAADEGAAPRGAGRRRHRRAARREAAGDARRLCAQDAAHRAWRQDVDRARARRPDRRRHDIHHAGRRSRPRRRRVQAARARQSEKRGAAAAGDTVALRQARSCQDRRHA